MKSKEQIPEIWNFLKAQFQEKTQGRPLSLVSKESLGCYDSLAPGESVRDADHYQLPTCCSHSLDKKDSVPEEMRIMRLALQTPFLRSLPMFPYHLSALVNLCCETSQKEGKIVAVEPGALTEFCCFHGDQSLQKKVVDYNQEKNKITKIYLDLSKEVLQDLSSY
jgi:hypothetical protein